MKETKRDNLVEELRRPDTNLREVRALLCQIVRTCSREGVNRLRGTVLDEEPVFYVDEP
jgi:hypothetical protein